MDELGHIGGDTVPRLREADGAKTYSRLMWRLQSSPYRRGPSSHFRVKAESKKALENNASKNLLLNWKPSDLDTIKPDDVKGIRIEALWRENKRVLKWFKAAGFHDNTLFLHEA